MTDPGTSSDNLSTRVLDDTMEISIVFQIPGLGPGPCSPGIRGATRQQEHTVFAIRPLHVSFKLVKIDF